MRPALIKHSQGLQFRTNAAGDILLQADWEPLLSHLAAAGPWFIQTRTPYARLIAETDLPTWDFASAASAKDPASLLHLDLRQWHQATARLEFCRCCQSPGYVEVREASGQLILQLRAPATVSLDHLAAHVATVAAKGHAAPEAAADRGPVLLPVFAREAAPRLPATELPGLLDRCATAKLPLLWRLLNAGSDHRRAFCPHTVEFNGGLLTAGDGLTHSCQLNLASAATLAVEPGVSGPLLHVLGRGDVLLLTLTAAPDTPENHRWSELLAAPLRHRAHS